MNFYIAWHALRSRVDLHGKQIICLRRRNFGIQFKLFTHGGDWFRAVRFSSCCWLGGLIFCFSILSCPWLRFSFNLIAIIFILTFTEYIFPIFFYQITSIENSGSSGCNRRSSRCAFWWFRPLRGGTLDYRISFCAAFWALSIKGDIWDDVVDLSSLLNAW